MYMATMATHMSMQFKTMRMEEAISIVAIGFVIGANCRGMLAGASQGNTGGMHGIGAGGRGGDQMPQRGFEGRSQKAGIVEEAGTSRSRGTRDARYKGGEASSESD